MPWQVAIAWIETDVKLKFLKFLKYLKLVAFGFTVVVKQIDRSFIYFNKFQDEMYFM